MILSSRTSESLPVDGSILRPIWRFLKSVALRPGMGVIWGSLWLKGWRKRLQMLLLKVLGGVSEAAERGRVRRR